MIYLDEEKCLKKWKPSRSYNSQEYIIRKIITTNNSTSIHFFILFYEKMNKRNLNFVRQTKK